MSNKNIGVDPDNVFGLQANVAERLRAANDKQDPTFVVELDAFLKASPERRKMFTEGCEFKLPEYLELTSLPINIQLSELKERPYIYSFSDNIQNFSGRVVKASGKTLVIPFPKKLGKVTTEREMLQRYKGCAGLDGEELIEAAKKVVPTFEQVFGNFTNAIIESEEGRANLIPTKVGTWFIAFCVKDDELRVFSARRSPVGWYEFCSPVKLGSEWDADSLLYLATVS